MRYWVWLVVGLLWVGEGFSPNEVLAFKELGQAIYGPGFLNGTTISDEDMCNNFTDWIKCDPSHSTFVSIIGKDFIFNGTLSDSIQYLSNLTVLDFYRPSNLYGTLPDSIGNLTNLVILSFWPAHLSGTIPSTIGNLKSLVVLELEQNQFSGTIPSTLGELTYLTYIDFGDNSLTGTIPEYFGNFMLLQELWLESNGLTGTIPKSFSNLTSLLLLRLDNNAFEGTIFDIVLPLISLTNLYFSHNYFEGSIPSDIQYLSRLLSLDASYNKLTGTLPPEIGSLTSIYYLNVASNYLNGTIPPVLLNFYQLDWIDVSRNSIIGYIPKLTINDTNSSIFSYFNNETVPYPINLFEEKLRWEQSTFRSQFGLYCGIVSYDCDCSQESRCFLTCYQSGYMDCPYPCEAYICSLPPEPPLPPSPAPSTVPIPTSSNTPSPLPPSPEPSTIPIPSSPDNSAPQPTSNQYLEVTDVVGYPSITLNKEEQFVNVSNSQVKIMGDVSISSFSLYNSSTIINGSLKIVNGSLLLTGSKLFVEETTFLVGVVIKFGLNSLIICNEAVTIKNTNFIVDWDHTSQYKSLITFPPNGHIDLPSITLQITSTTSPPNCYHLKTGSQQLFITFQCENSDSGINFAMVGGITGGVVGLIILFGVLYCAIKRSRPDSIEKEMRQFKTRKTSSNVPLPTISQ